MGGYNKKNDDAKFYSDSSTLIQEHSDLTLTGNFKPMATSDDTTRPTKDGGSAFDILGSTFVIPAHRA